MFICDVSDYFALEDRSEIMVAPQIRNIEVVLEEWMGPMSKFVLSKQMADANVDPNAPTQGSLVELVDLLEDRCLHKMLSDSKVPAVKEDLLKAIKKPLNMEEEKAIELNRKINNYLREKFGDVAIYTLNLEKKKRGIDDITTTDDLLALADGIKSILDEMVEENISTSVYNGLVNIIKEMED